MIKTYLRAGKEVAMGSHVTEVGGTPLWHYSKAKKTLFVEIRSHLKQPISKYSYNFRERLFREGSHEVKVSGQS